MLITLIILTATMLLWSLPSQSRDEAWATLNLFNLIEHHDQSAEKKLVWLQVGQPDLCQWEARGHGDVVYKVWFEQGVGWRVQKMNDGIVTLDLTAISEQEAKGVALLEHR